MKHPTFLLLELYQILKTDSSLDSPLSLEDIEGELDGQFGEEAEGKDILQGLNDLDANGFTIVKDPDGKYFLDAPLLSRKELDAVEDSLYRDPLLSDEKLEESVDLLESLLPYAEQRDLSLVLRNKEENGRDPSSLFDKIELVENAIVRSKRIDFAYDGRKIEGLKPLMLSLSESEYVLTGLDGEGKEEEFDLSRVSSLRVHPSAKKKAVRK